LPSLAPFAPVETNHPAIPFLLESPSFVVALNFPLPLLVSPISFLLDICPRSSTAHNLVRLLGPPNSSGGSRHKLKGTCRYLTYPPPFERMLLASPRIGHSFELEGPMSPSSFPPQILFLLVVYEASVVFPTPPPVVPFVDGPGSPPSASSIAELGIYSPWHRCRDITNFSFWADLLFLSSIFCPTLSGSPDEAFLWLSPSSDSLD